MDNDRVGGRAYVVSVMDNHSRCILACALTRTQDLASYLSVLYAAVERYGSPEALVTDGGGVFRARQARAVYEALGIAKHEIERGRPWQNYVETTFNVQRRMADWHFARAEGWPELELAHERFVEDYNAQSHFAHRDRDGGRCSPGEVLGFASGVRHREEELSRAFFSARFVRVRDALGYARFMHWRVYGEEALAGREAALWLAAESLTLEHAGEPLSRYDVRLASGTGELRSLARPRLFGSRPPAASAVRPGRTRRGRMAEGAEAGRVLSQVAPAPAVPPAGPVSLRGGALAIPSPGGPNRRPQTFARGLVATVA